jgi:uncharacterized SAM-binding protein YcdF (DUF218 family)
VVEGDPLFGFDRDDRQRERRDAGDGIETWAPTVPDPNRTQELDVVADADDDATPVHPTRLTTRRTWVKPLRRAVLLVFVVLVGYYLVSLYQVWSTGRSDEARPVDAIVVLGAAQYDGRPSPQLQARLDHVVALWPEGYAPVVVVTGGNQPGDRFTEAEASRDYLVAAGIPADAILLENEGRTTFESMLGVQRILARRGETRVLLVTDPFHALRSKLIADEVGLDPFVSPTETSTVTGGDSVRRHLEEAAGVALGRIISFRRLVDLTG